VCKFVSCVDVGVYVYNLDIVVCFMSNFFLVYACNVDMRVCVYSRASLAPCTGVDAECVDKYTNLGVAACCWLCIYIYSVDMGICIVHTRVCVCVRGWHICVLSCSGVCTSHTQHTHALLCIPTMTAQGHAHIQETQKFWWIENEYYSCF